MSPNSLLQKSILLLIFTGVLTAKCSKVSSLRPYFLQNIKIREVKPLKPKIIPSNITSAMIYVESNGNDSAYNKTEEAVGCLQIRPIMVREVNRILKKKGNDKRFEMEDRWEREKSLEMFHIWREHHHPNSTDEVIARNWNGGPNGFKKESTLKYWKKVKGRLEIES